MATYICTLYIDSKKYKSIASFDGCLYLTEEGNATSIKLTKVSVVPDPQLRSLSSIPYIVTTNDTIYMDDKTYKCTSLPKPVQYKVIPILNSTDIIEYKIINKEYDYAFIYQNYVRELKDASLVIIPVKDISIDDYVLGDLLIKSFSESKNGLLCTAFSDVTVTIRNDQIVKKYDRYLYVSGLSIKGTSIDLPSTYTKENLCSKFDILQMRLNNYGQDRVNTILSALRSIPDLIGNTKNMFMASSIYQDVSALVEKIKTLT